MTMQITDMLYLKKDEKFFIACLPDGEKLHCIGVDRKFLAELKAKGFLKVEKDFYANVRNISSLTETTLSLSNEETFPVLPRKSKRLQQKLEKLRLICKADRAEQSASEPETANADS